MFTFNSLPNNKNFELNQILIISRWKISAAQMAKFFLKARKHCFKGRKMLITRNFSFLTVFLKVSWIRAIKTQDCSEETYDYVHAPFLTVFLKVSWVRAIKTQDCSRETYDCVHAASNFIDAC